MAPDQIAALNSELKSDPAGLGYAAFLPDLGGNTVRLLNATSTRMLKPTLIGDRALLSAEGLGPVAGDALLTKLDAIAASGAPGTGPLKRMLKHLYAAEGLDIGDAATQAALAALVGQDGVTQDEVTAVQEMAMAPCSRAQLLGFGSVAAHEITLALFNDDGTPR